MNSKKSWLDFFGGTKDSPPSQGLVGAMRFVAKSGSALDLGAGAGKDSRYLLEKGYQVTAVDADPHSKDFLQKLPNQSNLNIVTSKLQNFEFKKYDLVTSWFTLSFLPVDELKNVIRDVKMSLKSGGVFTGNLFGVEDEWNKTRKGMSFFTIDEVRMQLIGLEILVLKELRNKGKLANGAPKYWHVIVFVARKK